MGNTVAETLSPINDNLQLKVLFLSRCRLSATICNCFCGSVAYQRQFAIANAVAEALSSVESTTIRNGNIVSVALSPINDNLILQMLLLRLCRLSSQLQFAIEILFLWLCRLSTTI